MEEGWRMCLVHGGAVRDGGGSSGRRRRCRRPSLRSQLAQKEACERNHTGGGKRGAGGRNGRGGGPSSGGKHAAAMGSAQGVGSACESAGGAGRGAAPGRAARSWPLAKDCRLQNDRVGGGEVVENMRANMRGQGARGAHAEKAMQARAGR